MANNVYKITQTDVDRMVMETVNEIKKRKLNESTNEGWISAAASSFSVSKMLQGLLTKIGVSNTSLFYKFMTSKIVLTVVIKKVEELSEKDMQAMNESWFNTLNPSVAGGAIGAGSGVTFSLLMKIILKYVFGANEGTPLYQALTSPLLMGVLGGVAGSVMGANDTGNGLISKAQNGIDNVFNNISGNPQQNGGLPDNRYTFPGLPQGQVNQTPNQSVQTTNTQQPNQQQTYPKGNGLV